MKIYFFFYNLKNKLIYIFLCIFKFIVMLFLHLLLFYYKVFLIFFIIIVLLNETLLIIGKNQKEEYLDEPSDRIDQLIHYDDVKDSKVCLKRWIYFFYFLIINHIVENLSTFFNSFFFFGLINFYFPYSWNIISFVFALFITGNLVY